MQTEDKEMIISTLQERSEKAGFNHDNFLNFVAAKPSEEFIQNYEGIKPSWNHCAIGSFLKSIGIQDDLSKRTLNIGHYMRPLLTAHLNYQLCYLLATGEFQTYGDLQSYIAQNNTKPHHEDL